MSKHIKILAVLGLVAGIAACASGSTEEEFIVVEPISVEPIHTGKYK